jgi:hypothetical protein
VSTRSAGDQKWPRLEPLREPLVLFFVAGAILFGLDRVLDSRRGGAEIRVPEAVRAAAAEKLGTSLGRTASDDEVRTALGTWIREEAVYREGLRRGLDKSDPVIRERVVHKTLVALHRENAAPAIDDAELERWFSVRLQRYSLPMIFDLEVMTLLAVPTDAEINALLERLLRAEQRPAEPGPQARLHVYRNAPEGLLVGSYGAGLIALARTVAPGQWVRVPGDHTVHLLRVHQARGAEPPRFEGLRARVLDDWRREQREQALEQRLEQLVRRYRIRYSTD